MSTLIDAVVPSTAEAIAFAALLVTLAAWSVAAAAAAGARRLREADLVCGFGLAAIAFTLFGVVTPVGFRFVAYGLLALAVPAAIVLWRRRDGLLGSLSWRAAALAIPLIAMATAMLPTQWDEFTHWLPNARYLFDVDTFPRRDLPSWSVYPAYPHGMAFPIYAASRLAGRFGDNLGGVFNLLLLLSLAALVARLVADRLSVRAGWGLAGVGVLAATVLNPTFVPKLVFTAYADSATAVALAFCAVLGCRLIEALGRGAEIKALLWQLALAGAALIVLKQVNLVMLAALYVALGAIALRDPAVPFGRFARAALLALAIPAAAWVLWRVHVSIHVTEGEFVLRPVSEWAVSLAPDVLARMALILSKKGGYLAVMLVAVAWAVYAIRRPRTMLDRLAIVTAALFLAYNAFLLFTYLAAFSAFEAQRAGSFWRYNTHLGGAALVFAAEGLAVAWRRYGSRRMPAAAGIAAALVAFALPLALPGKVRFDIRAPKMYVRAVAEDIATLGREDRLGVVDASGDGTYAMMVRYALRGRTEVLTGNPDMKAELVRGAVATWGSTLLWVHVPTPEIETALGVALAPRASHLLARDGGAWRAIRSWPYPGYANPADVPD